MLLMLHTTHCTIETSNFHRVNMNPMQHMPDIMIHIRMEQLHETVPLTAN